MKAGARVAIDAHPERLYWWGLATLVAGAALWLAGHLLLRAADFSSLYWDTIWALGGISFLGAVIIPIPGTTTAYLVTVRDTPVLAFLGVVGAALGGTLGAAFLLALGHTGRAVMRKHSEHSRMARRTLAWGNKLAKRWTYVGIGILLVPPFLPRLPVLYAAVLAHLKTVPFLGVVFAGTFVRNMLVLAVVYGVFSLPFVPGSQ